MSFPRLKDEKDPTAIRQWAGALTRQLERNDQVVLNGQVTLAAEAIETTVIDNGIEVGAEVFLEARDASAALITGRFVSAVGDGSFTFEHSEAAGGEVFAYGIIGPGGAGDDI